MPGHASNAERPPPNCAAAGWSSPTPNTAIKNANKICRLSAVIGECPDSPAHLRLWATDGAAQAPRKSLCSAKVSISGWFGLQRQFVELEPALKARPSPTRLPSGTLECLEQVISCCRSAPLA